MKRALSLLCLLSLLACSRIEEPAVKRHADPEQVREDFAQGKRSLPVLLLSTHNKQGIPDRENWYPAELTLLSTGEEQDDAIQVKGRGNASWAFPKKAFDIRFGSETSLLGMPEAQRWCALANWRDITLMRDAVSYEISRLSALEWTPEGRFVDLVLNGQEMGNYYISQKVDIAATHVDVGEDGLLLLFDEYFDKDFRFRSALRDLPVNIITAPGTSLDKQAFSEIKSYISEVEHALYKGGRWQDYLDADSFCDYLIIHELTGNNEPTRPHSVYMHKKADGLLQAGPVWDFDCRTFRPGTRGLIDSKAIWYDALLRDPDFVRRLKERYQRLKPRFAAAIPDFIDRTYEEIVASAETNARMWPIETRFFSPNGDENLSYTDAVQRLKEAFLERLDEVEQALKAL